MAGVDQGSGFHQYQTSVQVGNHQTQSIIRWSIDCVDVTIIIAVLEVGANAHKGVHGRGTNTDDLDFLGAAIIQGDGLFAALLKGYRAVQVNEIRDCQQYIPGDGAQQGIVIVQVDRRAACGYAQFAAIQFGEINRWLVCRIDHQGVLAHIRADLNIADLRSEEVINAH